MASRAFPESDLDSLVLFGQWLEWFFAFDDLRDEGPVGTDPGAVNDCYDRLFDDPGFSGLWERTCERVGAGWRRRFHEALRQHRIGCVREAGDRRDGRIPAPGEYESLRRMANGPYLFLLPEPVLRVEVPAAVAASPPWLTLLDCANDITAWCNDLVSVHRETTFNYMIVLAHHRGLTQAQATAFIRKRIATRLEDMTVAAQQLPDVFTACGLDRPAACDVSRVAMTLLGTPGGHLEWLRESARYV
jgi:hypothetical protein